MAKTRVKPVVRVAKNRPAGTAKVKWRPERAWKKLVPRDVPDELRAAVVERVEGLGITLAELARACEHVPDYSTLRRFLQSRTTMRSDLLHRVLKKLGWTGRLVWRGHF